MNDRIKNRIEKRMELKAPVSRVWRALTDHREFGEWFRVKLDGPFVPGQLSTGHITYPGYEHVKWRGRGAKVGARAALFVHLASVRHRPQNGLLQGDAHARRIQAGENRYGHTASCSPSPVSTRSPATAALEAFRMNDGGWTEQMKNIESYVAQKP